MTLGRQRLAAAGAGLVLGYALAQMGFADFSEVHKMFVLEDLRLIFVFACGVMLTGLFFARSRLARSLPRRTFHPGIWVGSIFFGLGWALCGACPGVMFVQLGQGVAPVLVTLLGAFAGARVANWVNARYLHWEGPSC